MSRRPVRSRAVAVVAAAIATVSAVGPLPASAGPTPTVAAVAEQAASDDVTVRGVSQIYWVEREGTWNVVLDVAGAPTGSTLSASIATRFESLDDLYRAYFGLIEGDPLASIPALDLDDVAPDATGTREVSLAVTLRQEAAPRPGWAFLSDGLRPGVYPVSVVVADAEGEELARTIVFITRVESDGDPGDPEDRPSPVLVAPLLRLEAAPTISADGDDETSLGTVAEAVTLADGLAFAGDLPVTLVPRPETVEALARQADGRAVFDALDGTGGARDVVDGTYVRLPLHAWVARGMAAELTRQRDRGNQILTEHLGRVDSSLWAADDGFDAAAADTLWNVGVRSVVLGPGQLAGDERPLGPVSVTTAQGRAMDAVVIDRGLSDTLTRRDDPVLGLGDLAAELALISATADGPTGVVLDPASGWPADSTDVIRLASLLDDPAAPVRTVTVTGLLDALPSRVRRTLARPPVPNLADYPPRLDSARTRLASLGGMVGRTPEVVALDQRLLLSASAALTAAERDRYVASVARIVDQRFAGIDAPLRETITLTSSDGDIPLTVRNDLDEPVRVLVRLESDSRVDFRDPAEQVIDLQPGTNRIAIAVHTTLPGDSPIDITLLTPDGAVVLDEVDYTVRSTAISGIGVVLSVGAALVLVLWWFRHWRRTRRLRRARADGARVGAEIAATDPPVPSDATRSSPHPASPA